ncbi:MAG: DUF881 domain-containing protein [Propionibacteriales bacterium]|nr:DUF881 domain-containing protein [Propionibacteriales bacterium]
MRADRRASLERWRDLFRFRLRGRWRPAAAAMFVFAGALFVTTSINSKGLDLRESSITDLNHVVRGERDHVTDQQDQVTGLTREVSALSRQVSDVEVKNLQAQIDKLRRPAGFTPVTGAGLTVTLTDAPKSAIDAARATPGGLDPNELVVHQQDIQAVVNALWLGGARAMTIQGQRVISTTGIKCVGNTVMLHGVPYSPPYVISAIGDVGALQTSLDDSEYVDAYLTFVENYQLGYQVQPEGSLDFPGYEGISTLKYAVAGNPERPTRD